MQNLSASVLVVDSAVNDAKYAPKMHLMPDLVNYTFSDTQIVKTHDYKFTTSWANASVWLGIL